MKKRRKRGGSKSYTKVAGVGVRRRWENGVEVQAGKRKEGGRPWTEKEGRGDEGKELVTDKQGHFFWTETNVGSIRCTFSNTPRSNATSAVLRVFLILIRTTALLAAVWRSRRKVLNFSFFYHVIYCAPDGRVN